MSKTIFTLFRGGNLVGVGAEAAGLKDIGGVEYDKDIAGVCDVNFPDSPTTIADIREVDPATLACGRPDNLHASPSCRTASGANQSAEVNEDGLKETQEDIESGQAICRFLTCWKPNGFTLENVWGYRNYNAFGYICEALNRLGYSYDYWHLNAADYGVPQTRKRLILVAKFGKGQRIPKPIPTHHNPKDYEPGQLSMFESTTKPWVGWYESILDLIPTLPESEFAAWQLARLPGEIKETVLLNRNQSERDDYYRTIDYPAYAVCAEGDSGRRRAFILDCQLAGDPETERGVTLRQGDAPMFTVTAGKDGRQPVRAWLVGTNANDTSGARIYQEPDEPAQTVRVPSGGRVLRAWLVDQVNSSTVTSRPDNEPAFTQSVYSSKHQPPRAWLSAGRVVRMNARALARFQSIPDSYVLPDNNKLACTVIGNGVPCLLYRRIVEQLI